MTLKTLNISRTKIREFNVQRYPLLTGLYVGGTELTDLNFSNSNKMSILSIAFSSIKKLDASKLNELSVIKYDVS